MTLSDDIKAKIQAEYDSWKDKLWAGKSLKERQKLGQFATPPELVFKMLEKFDSLEDKDILDPCLGAGNLIASAVIAGADPKRCYGIELDPEVLEIAKQRLGALGVPACNLKCGNALDSDAYNFEPEDKPVAHDQEVVYKAAKQKTAVKQVECTDRNSIIGRTFEQLLAGNESLSAGKVWRLWAEEAKHAYARYNAWKVGKPRDEVKVVHSAYRQWKIDQEAKWCKHFNSKNPNDRHK